MSPTGLLCFVSSFLIDGYGQNYTDRHRRWFLAVIIFYIGLAVTLSCPRRGKWAQVSLARSLLSIMMMMAMCWWWWWRSSSLLTNQHHHADYKEDDDVCCWWWSLITRKLPLLAFWPWRVLLIWFSSHTLAVPAQQFSQYMRLPEIIGDLKKLSILILLSKVPGKLSKKNYCNAHAHADTRVSNTRKLRTLVKYISVCQFESFVQSNRKPVDKYDTREYPRPLDVHILYTSL